MLVAVVGQKVSSVGGPGKGVFDAWGGEYVVGGYRDCNGVFYPHLV